MPQLLEEVAAAFLDPSSFGTWPMMIVSARPTMNPLITGSEMKLARNPRRSTPASSAASPVVIASAGGHRHEAVAAYGHERRDRCRRQRRGGRHRPDDQLARASQRRVEQQRPWGRVQADHRGHPRDRCVGQRLGHQHRPNRETGNEIAPQPRALIAAQRREHEAHGSDPRPGLADREEWCTRVSARHQPGGSRRDRSA